ncbi:MULTISPECIES: MarR family transcriptional regulator [Bacillus]|uniref:MarR family transcriptional regulator n=1 Tax=Bacillus TaxID=1386 RepID=UPI0011AA781C|nr:MULTISPECIES: MarR family transcriptional regulator [Bacillus amyloliquefaciens group]MCM3446191.1 MarR family transcriptional regulator [Bacillus velezensis]MEC2239810.1 MarR family transcriptional regulator [Bacillus velezensis]QPV77954.1 MarR family transcriptional regulator [Bacillus velezensis]UNE49639.1 MarR family transcriptional regulator [Bacillus amyloliquefaciens]UUI53191.1 MarR family transcriptional regulator [Bacillus velezensis]
MSTRNTRSETEETAIQLFRKMATRTILFHQAAAQSLGLFPTDLKSADILNEAGPMTAGELGKKTGLSTGSVTALIDRLEKAGYVMRKKDPEDKRRVIIVPLTAGKANVKKLFSSLSQSTISLCRQYKEEELQLIFDFLGKATDMMEDELEKLK